MLFAIAQAAATASSPPQYSTFIYILGALVAGGALNVAVTAYRRWSRGPIEDKEIIGNIVKGEVAGMKDLLAEYRVEVEITKRQLEEYREQLSEITRELARAQVRIGRLEDELREAGSRRAEIEAELLRVKAERDGLVDQRQRLERESASLRTRVDALEGFAHRVHPDEPPS